ncbi:MAG: hypothetical protein RTU63_12315, partial [Candidatus Thorarchaeota archaeon]
MKSLDGGEHWFEIVNGLSVAQEFYKIIVDKHNPDTIYLATQVSGVFISYNGGGLWEPWTEGLTNLYAGSSGNNIANPMAMSADGHYLYIGTWGSGVFRRTIYIDPVTTTTTNTTTTVPPFTTTLPPNGDPQPFPTDMLVLVLGVFSGVIVLVLVLKRMKSTGK